MFGPLEHRIDLRQAVVLSVPWGSFHVRTDIWSDAVASGSAFAAFASRQSVCEGSILIILWKCNAIIVVEELFVCTDVGEVFCIQVPALSHPTQRANILVMERWYRF